jgi:hypothetical protein
MTTNINVTEQTTTVTTVNDVTTITLANAGVQGIPGIGYTGVTSTSNITIGLGLKTFTLVAGYAGAFITGMRIRAIHSDTPTYYLEGTANYVGAGTLIITVDKFNGSGSHNSWAFASAGEVGQTGATGATGVIAVTSPITNTGSASSAIVGIDQTLLSITRSQVSDFTSGTVASAGFATTSGTATYATTSGTATYATTSGTAVNISGTVTQSQVTNLVSDLALKAPLASPTFSGTVTLPFANSGLLQSGTAGAILVSDSAPGLGYIPYTASTSGNYAWLDLGVVARENIANAFTVGGHSITSEGTAVIPLFIRAASGQTGNLQEFQNSSGGTVAAFNNGGGIRTVGSIKSFSLEAVAATLALQPAAATTIGAVIRGAASQSANLQEWQNSAAGTAVSISPTGIINITNASIRVNTQNTGFNARINVSTDGTAVIGQVIRGAASQSANLQEWQNDSGTVLSRISSSGQIVTTQSMVSSGDVVSTGGAVKAFNGLVTLGGVNSGGFTQMTRQTAATTNPGANIGSLYFRDGTTAGTLKLVVRAGTAGAETTILDNIPQT